MNQVAHSDLSNKKKRKTPRVSVEIEAQVTSSGGGTVYQGLLTRQIGKNGCLLMGLDKAAMGDEVSLKLKIGKHIISATGKIIYRLKDFDGICAGVKFIRMPDSDKQYLSDFIDKCLLKKAVINRVKTSSGDLSFIQISGAPHAIEITTVIKEFIKGEHSEKIALDLMKADLKYMSSDDLIVISSEMKNLGSKGFSGKVAIVMDTTPTFALIDRFLKGNAFKALTVRHSLFSDMVSAVKWLEQE